MHRSSLSWILVKKIIKKHKVIHAFLFSKTNLAFYMRSLQSINATITSSVKRKTVNPSHICIIFSKDDNSHLKVIEQIHDAFTKVSNIKIDNPLIILTNESRIPTGCTHGYYILYYVPDLLSALQQTARLLYLRYIPDKIIGITGTNGKTSTIFYTQQILGFFNKESVTIGTLGLITEHQGIKNEEFIKYYNTHPSLTTPDLLSLSRILNLCKTHGINYALLEVSSHALAQNRIYGLKLDIAAFCNFSQDHLDYHHTMQQYFLAKIKITNMLKKRGKIFISQDVLLIGQKICHTTQQDSHTSSTHTSNKVDSDIDDSSRNALSVIVKQKALLNSYIIYQESLNGQEVEFILTHRNATTYRIRTHLNIIGASQIANLHLALNIALTLGCPIHQLSQSLQNIISPKGRMQRVQCHTYNIFIDYAHTPDALRSTLYCLRQIINQTNTQLLTNKKLLLVFGAGGGRDQTKRKLMGQAAHEVADEVIITNDNPRFEDPLNIAMQIKAGCPGAQICLEREKAIALAIKNLTQHDVLLVCGKGHEQYQSINGQDYYFDDYEICKKYALQKHEQQN